MKKIGIIFTTLIYLMSFFSIGCGANAAVTEQMNMNFIDGKSAKLISVSDGTHEIIYSLNESSAAQSLYAQLPLETEVQNYGSNEKIFYPPDKLDTSDVSEGGGEAGGLAYFSPWGNVVMYYDSFSKYSGLYLLGEAVSGKEQIERLTGTIKVTAYTDEQYTSQDVKNLHDFLLARPTKEDLSGKNYDLDGDGKWSAFNLCLMRQEVTATTEHHSNTLVAYFSRTGTTETIADYIVDITGADVFEIEAAVPYTDEDIQYSNSSCRANQEQNDKSLRPEIAGALDNIEQYDTIFLGYPIWWSQELRIIDTFLESYDFSGATVVPFCTSHSSGIGTSESNLENLSVEYGNLLNGRRFSASSTREDVAEWIETLSIKS